MRHAYRHSTTVLVSLFMLALGGCGGGGGGGTAPDTEKPSVTILAPASGAEVSGDLTVSAVASDNESVAGVQFELDGEALGSEDTDPPYEVVWHVDGTQAGTHTLRATARDPSGNVASAQPVDVTVAATPSGVIEVTTVTTGEGTDADGYTVSVDGVVRGTVEVNGTLTIDGIAFGLHTLALGGISSFCTAAGGPGKQVSVGAAPVTAGFALTCEAAPAAVIAFEAVAAPGGPIQIRTIGADGAGEATVVTNGEVPAWSPDGSQIAFLRPAVGKTTLFRVNADGSGLTELATLPAVTADLDWGPGGTLAFTATRPAAAGATVVDIYLIESDGSNLRPLFGSPGYRLSPAWSPNGSRLAFAAVLADGDHTELSLASPDGSSVEALTSGFYDLSPTWSPDGTMLAFRRDDVSQGTNTIRIVGADGTGLRKLSDYNGRQFSPSWSPDGAWVAFTSENISGQPLLIARIDGSDVREVPGSFRFSGQPDWRADGQ